MACRTWFFGASETHFCRRISASEKLALIWCATDLLGRAPLHPFHGKLHRRHDHWRRNGSAGPLHLRITYAILAATQRKLISPVYPSNRKVNNSLTSTITEYLSIIRLSNKM